MIPAFLFGIAFGFLISTTLSYGVVWSKLEELDHACRAFQRRRNECERSIESAAQQLRILKQRLDDEQDSADWWKKDAS